MTIFSSMHGKKFVRPRDCCVGTNKGQYHVSTSLVIDYLQMVCECVCLCESDP